MMQYSLRRAVIAARVRTFEEPPVPEPRCKIRTVEPPPPPAPRRDWLLVASGAQNDAHVTAYKVEAEWAGVPKSTFETVRRAVCFQFGVSRLEIMSHRREIRISRARQALMYMAKKYTSYSFPQIARYAGGFDHTTVLYAVKRIADLRTADPALDATMSAVERVLQEEADGHPA